MPVRPGSRRRIPSVFIHSHLREVLEIQKKVPKQPFCSNLQIALIAISAIQKIIQNLIIISYLSNANPYFSITYFIPYAYKNLTFIIILYYNIFIDISCRTILFNFSLQHSPLSGGPFGAVPSAAQRAFWLPGLPAFRRAILHRPAFCPNALLFPLPTCFSF